MQHQTLLTRTFENRGFLYSYATRLFSLPPDIELLEVIASDAPVEESALFAGDDSSLVHIQAKLKTAAMQSSLSDLTRDYSKLFIGPEKLPAPPWESVYLSEGDLIFQKSTLDVREAYKEAGYQAAGYPHEADDHIATELHFMMSLTSDATRALQQNDSERVRAFLVAQKKFLANHLSQWVTLFANRLKENVPLNTEEFYSLAAWYVAELCRIDAENLDMIIEMAQRDEVYS